MKNSWFTFSILALTLAPVSVPAAVTDSAVCLKEGITRIVELRAEGPTGVPCSVDYIRPDEDRPDQQLWLAKYDANYCVTKFESFLVKLENKLNWSCEKQVATVAESVQVDEAILASDDRDIETAGAPLTDIQTESRQLAGGKASNEGTILPDESSSDGVPGVIVDDAVPRNPPASSSLPAEQVSEIYIIPSEDSPPTAAYNENVATLERADPSADAAQPILEPRFPTDISFTETQQSAPGDLDFTAIRAAIPTGFYSADPSIPHLGLVQQCPADGYFIWNSRDQDRPVFEMGPVLEFGVRMGSVKSIDTLSADDPNTPMMLRPVTSAITEGSVQTLGVELIFLTADSDNVEQGSSAVCRYIRG